MQIVKAMLSAIGIGIAIVLLAAMLAPTAEARSVLFDGSIPPNQIDDIGFNDPDAGGQRLAEDFQVGIASAATGVTFLGGYYPTSTPESDAFTITIFGDAAGLPDPSNIIAQIPVGDANRTDTGVNALGIRLYSYTAGFSAVQLAAGTPYWVMVVNDTSDDANDDWVWAGRHEGGIYARSFDGGLTWFDTPPGSFSFQIMGEAAGTGACCLPDGSCVVLGRSECEDQHGNYVGEGVSCDPYPCEATPVEQSTWGSVKARYR